jgi:hypothetical protein
VDGKFHNLHINAKKIHIIFLSMDENISIFIQMMYARKKRRSYGSQEMKRASIRSLKTFE